jgi:hypothetical protein
MMQRCSGVTGAGERLRKNATYTATVVAHHLVR